MCDIWKSTDNRMLSLAQLEAQLDSLEQLGTLWVVFSGGEPLMNPNIFRLSDMLRERGIRVTLLSSGLLFERYAREIAEHIDDAIVSLDGPAQVHDKIRGVPGAFHQIARGIWPIHLIRPDFVVAARCTVQKLNHAVLAKTARDARAIDVSSISFLAADLTSSAFNRDVPWSRIRQSEVALNEMEIAALDLQIQQLLQDPFVIDSPRHLRRIAQHFRAHLGLQPHESPRCNAPWVSAVMSVDGFVRPCFFHAPIGSIRASDDVAGSLHQIVNSTDARKFRQNLDIATDPTCQNCVCSLYR